MNCLKLEDRGGYSGLIELAAKFARSVPDCPASRERGFPFKRPRPCQPGLGNARLSFDVAEPDRRAGQPLLPDLKLGPSPNRRCGAVYLRNGHESSSLRFIDGDVLTIHNNLRALLVTARHRVT